MTVNISYLWKVSQTSNNTNYRKGASFEYACKGKLENQGYTVLRTAGSHGFADLIAIKPSDGQQLKDRILFIQCKTNPMTRRDYAELKQLERHLDVKIEVWVKHWKRRLRT